MKATINNEGVLVITSQTLEESDRLEEWSDSKLLIHIDYET